MIHLSLEHALAANPKRKGVGLFSVFSPTPTPPDMTWDYRWIWARSKLEAVGKVAMHAGCYATRYHAGVMVESDGEVPNIQRELYD